ncbi:putative AAA-ATPase [Methanobrevibacter cuticularis]|uniref:Putative AAA-ATPase n=1 Tax=Methanobrevibacter cuticularis TaxID=47311 RepID=A0A166DP14_9EURY|nr:ATP-binding protein [Methanobrevibacter cuticularis]KZX15805.1 putative AAA-ATPase [Methanobrevibacter cuticularis]
MKKLPIGIQTFREIQEENYVYIDKTKYIHKLATEGKSYFLSRPRRFGKSLLLSTIEELFNGNEKLFEGLYIYDKWDWEETYPIIHLDFTKLNFNTPKNLEKSLNTFLTKLAKDNGINLTNNELYSFRFAEIIEELYKKTNKRVVVLIDEYDKPIIDNISEKEILNGNQKILRSFYNVLKGADQYIKFIFITGISKLGKIGDFAELENLRFSKFANMSLFSSLNSLDDITLNRNFACICGYTHQDLRNNFKDYLSILKGEESLTEEETIDKINHWYDGYSWDGENKVYNPFSTLKLFKENEFSNYWFETATPELLINVLKTSNDYKEVLNPITVKQSRFKTFDCDNIDPISIFFQTGYLTITEKMIINEIIHYKLEFPNFEVESSLLDHLIDLNISEERTIERKEKIISYIEQCDNENFQKEMRAFLARIPNRIHIEREHYYQSIFLAWLYALGFETEGEMPTNIGFTDMILKEEDFTVLAEFKFSKINPKTDLPVTSYEKMLIDAIKQIKTRKYYEKYPDKKIIAIAVAFAGKQLQTQIKRIEDSLSY